MAFSSSHESKRWCCPQGQGGGGGDPRDGRPTVCLREPGVHPPLGPDRLPVGRGQPPAAPTPTRMSVGPASTAGFWFGHGQESRLASRQPLGSDRRVQVSPLFCFHWAVIFFATLFTTTSRGSSFGSVSTCVPTRSPKLHKYIEDHFRSAKYIQTTDPHVDFVYNCVLPLLYARELLKTYRLTRRILTLPEAALRISTGLPHSEGGGGPSFPHLRQLSPGGCCRAPSPAPVWRRP